ncbi:TonB-dependent receptor [Pseudomonas aeruginosa]|nr:TonB-dependent receptor [Pseudomonas aeruginosa]
MPLDVFDPAAYDASGGLVFDKIGKPARRCRRYATPQRRRRSPSCSIASTNTGRSTAACALRILHRRIRRLRPALRVWAASPVTGQGRRPRLRRGAVEPRHRLFAGGWPEIYASFSQGFQLPDVGIQLRNARRGFDIGSSNLEPVKTNNYELGWRGAIGGNTLGSLALFTTSKLGDVQSFNNGLILTRTKERIYARRGQRRLAQRRRVWGAAAAPPGCADAKAGRQGLAGH